MVSPNRLTLAALIVFLILIVAGGLGFCGKPSDHKPKPNPSSSYMKQVKPNPTVLPSKGIK